MSNAQPRIDRRSCCLLGISAFLPLQSFASAPTLSLRGTVFERAGLASAVDPLLIYAVALLESGFGNGKGTIAPWHWTLRAQTAYYPNTRREAESKLFDLLKGGRIIDIGAMQINLRWHGHRVAKPDDLLDPSTNIHLGAQILAEAIASAPGDLELGIGRYHNWSDQSRARNYGARGLAVLANLTAIARGHQ